VIYTIKEITVDQTRPLRHSVLRPGLPVESVIYTEDSQEGSLHLGLYIDELLVTVASFYKQSNILFQATLQYQLRGMATDPAFRNKNAGNMLLNYAICRLKEINADLLWCNGRLVAQSFYERLDFKTIGEMFLSVEIPHKVMWLALR